MAAIQIAKAVGAYVIACVGSESKAKVARSCGVDVVVNYQGWREVQRKTTGGTGVDVVIDLVGMTEESLKCMAWGERLVIVGFAGGYIEQVRMNRVLLQHVAIIGLHWGTC